MYIHRVAYTDKNLTGIRHYLVAIGLNWKLNSSHRVCSLSVCLLVFAFVTVCVRVSMCLCVCVCALNKRFVRRKSNTDASKQMLIIIIIG